VFTTTGRPLPKGIDSKDDAFSIFSTAGLAELGPASTWLGKQQEKTNAKLAI
jgi:hypothetical protein